MPDLNDREREILRKIADSTSEFYDGMKILQRTMDCVAGIRKAQSEGRCAFRLLEELDRLTATLDKMRKVA
jgi:glutamine synthetase type III